MINKKMKIFTMIVVTIIALFTKNIFIFAGGIPTYGYDAGGSYPPDFNNDNSPPGDERCNYTYVPYGFTCETDTDYTIDIDISDASLAFDAFANNDKQIFMNSNGLLEKNIIAGTSIGTNLYEERKAYWWIIKKTVKNCKKPAGCALYSFSCSTGKELNENGQYICRGEIHWYCAKPTAADSYSCESFMLANDDEDWQDDAYTKAVNELNKYKGTYTMDIPNSNDANCTNEECILTVEVNNTTISTPKNNVYPNPVVKKYYYEMAGACMNVKTGKVYYPKKLTSNGKCPPETAEYTENDYILIENNYDENIRHWHIFTPMNMKSNETYNIILKAKEKKLETASTCQNIYNKYKKNNEYTIYISPPSGQFEKNNSDYNKIKNGCYFNDKTIPIPITQKFYNEVDEDGNIKFKGFNFYYKPIDINNPFPNGIAKDSYWSDLYNATTNIIKTNNGNGNVNIKLSDSYKELTYVATDIDSQSIREYNKEDKGMIKVNTYTSWSNMNPDGTSNFVKDNLTVVGKQPKFKLGCGPQNINEYLDDKKTQKNPYYQEECVK